MGEAAIIPMIATTLSGSYLQSQAQKAQSTYQKDMFETNKKIAEVQAEDAIKRGDKAAVDYKTQVKQLKGSQNVALAAQGIDINTGSAADIKNDTTRKAALDELTIKNNAWREAWGYKVQALNYGQQGNLAKIAGQNESFNTLLTGGLQAAGYASKFSLPSGKKTTVSTRAGSPSI